MLIQIRDYIRREGIVSNQQIARAFHLDLTALEPMLELWLRKGVINHYQQKLSCQTSCFKCKQPAVYYSSFII